MLRKGNPHTFLVEMQTGAAIVENSVGVLRGLKMQLPYDPEILVLGIYPKKPRMLIQKIYAPLCLLLADLQSPHFRSSPATYQ